MIINSIIIENFRCYYGKNQVSFNSEGKITLIYGDSGYGKSSLLQFFRWVFYGDPDFGKNNDKPLFNLAAFEECGIDKKVKVSGQIDFEHLGIDYSLHKSVTFSTAIDPMKARIEEKEYVLELDAHDNNGYVPFQGDVEEKINSILPSELSKYFLLDGEKARDVVLNSKELKLAIHSLFGLDAYKNAISHIGSQKTKTSVLGKYAKSLAKTMTGEVNGLTISQLQDAIQNLYGEIVKREESADELSQKIEEKVDRKDELLKSLGGASNKQTMKKLIDANIARIEQHEQDIRTVQTEIGDVFYNWYPYLFLSDIASENSTTLREQKKLFGDNYEIVFENLEKKLLKEILDKDICVCGRPLDEESKEKIKNIIDIMPPDSYIYQFGQFVSKARGYISEAKTEVAEYNSLMDKISAHEQEIAKLESETQEKIDELKELDETKDIVEELEQIKGEIAKLDERKRNCDEEIAQKKQTLNMAEKKLNQEKKVKKVSEIYSNRIDFFEALVELLKNETREKEEQVRITLNECVKDIFKKLTTQTELDIEKIQFINEDFSLRATYLTGGQLAVDVYSYVIGITKALQEFEMDNNENPIIVDAPFAFTGNEQSEHIFKTLPTVAKQTILLTLDLNKIKRVLSETDNYEFYIIKNDTQEKAKIERGEISDINF